MTTKSHAPETRTRRWIIGTGAAVAAGAGFVGATWFNVFADTSGENALSVADANEQARTGKIYLVDIRRPDEWQRTGVGQTAIAIDMRRKDFETVLQSIFDDAGAKPVALICARGVRSQRLTARLQKAGFTDIIDVPEGMLGSGAGPGWIASDLPLRQPLDQELQGRVRVQTQRS